MIYKFADCLQMVSKIGVVAIFGNPLLCLYLCTEFQQSRESWKLEV